MTEICFVSDLCKKCLKKIGKCKECGKRLPFYIEGIEDNSNWSEPDAANTGDDI